MRIMSGSDLKLAYEILIEVMRFYDELGCKKALEHIIRLKRDIRQYHKMMENQNPVVALNADYDGAVLLYELDVPSDWTEEDVTEWFEENEVRHCIPSQYDCTGQEFTCWFKVFKRNDKWMTYHSVAIDV